MTMGEVAAHWGPAPLTAEPGQASNVFARHQLTPLVAESGAAIGKECDAVGPASQKSLRRGSQSKCWATREQGGAQQAPCFGLFPNTLSQTHPPS